MYKNKELRKSKVIASRFSPGQASLLSDMASKYQISESKLINFLVFVPSALIKSEYLDSLLKQYIKEPYQLLKLAEQDNKDHQEDIDE